MEEFNGRENDGCHSDRVSRPLSLSEFQSPGVRTATPSSEIPDRTSRLRSRSPGNNSDPGEYRASPHYYQHLLSEEVGCARSSSVGSFGSSPPREMKISTPPPQHLPEERVGDKKATKEIDEYWPVEGQKEARTPRLVHTWRCDQSILSLISTKDWIIAGSENGNILVFNKQTFATENVFKGHTGSVYSLALTPDERFLFSGAADSLVKVWDLSTCTEVFTIYSIYDIGDVFTIAWAPDHEYLFLGSQNASVQWIKLYEEESYNTTKDPSGLPSVRFDRFFDSKGPGGRMTPLQSASMAPKTTSSNTSLLEIPPKNIIPYAHYSYVYSLLVIKRTVTLSSKSTEEEYLVSGGGDGAVKIWNFNSDGTIEALYTLDTESSVFSMCCQDSFLYCGLSAGQVCMFDLDTRQIIRLDKLGDDDVMTMSLYCECLFRGGNRYVRKWDSKRYYREEWLAHNGLVLATVLTGSNDRTLLVTGGNDSAVSIWDVTSTVNQYTSPSDSKLFAASFNSTNSISFFKQYHSETGVLHTKKKEENSVAQTEERVAPLTLDHMMQTLRSFVAYKTVSGHDGMYVNDCRRCATFLRSILRHFGADSQFIPVENGGNPIVYARFSGSNSSHDTTSSANSKKKSRILFYGHYDVINAEKTDQWATDPFVLTNVDGYMYGRGVSDNKGPILAAIFAVAELVQRSELTNDVVFLIEGEEECGSLGFQTAIEQNKSLIGDIDWVLLSNSYWLDDVTPCLNYGLRGIIKATVEIKGDLPDLHSGVHGGVYREPTFDLVNLLSKLATDQGEIVLPEFHQSVRPVDDEERKLYEAIVARPECSDAVNSIGEEAILDKDTLMGRWRYPSLTIHKITVSGPGNSTLIPQAAKASLSLRIVPDQELSVIKESLTKFLHEQFATFKSDNHLTISIFHEAEPWVGDPTNRAFKLLQTVLRDEWQHEPIFIREGGSIPAVRFLEKAFNAPAAQLPCGQASDGAHLDNERLRVLNFCKTRDIFKRTFKELY